MRCLERMKVVEILRLKEMDMFTYRVANNSAFLLLVSIDYNRYC